MAIHAKPRIICAMSGGVDSAVAASLLLRDGYTVEGLHMTNWEDDDGYCTAARDLKDARRICTDLGIPLHHVNFAAEYRELVFGDFLRGYAAGRTPNPDVLCNREIKFGVLLDYARRLGAEWLATGHYARVIDGRLYRGADANKDQSYFLHQVGADAFRRVMFPLGALYKHAVRQLANAAGLDVFAKPDSTGICFIGERPFREFLSQFLPQEPGNIETLDGRVIGRHHGLAYYTLGQRQGLGVGGIAGAGDAPWFVTAKDSARNVLIAVQGRDDPRLWSGGCTTEHPHWIGDPPPAMATAAFECTVKTRYRQADSPCTLTRTGDGGLQVDFRTPQWAVTPGQYAVFYAGDECLGGAVIGHTVPAADGRSGRQCGHSGIMPGST